MAAGDWFEPQVDRCLTRQRGAVDNAKLVATFAAGVAATLTGTGLQVGGADDWDKRSVIALFFTVGMAVAVVILDRVADADLIKILKARTTHRWSDATVVTEIRIATEAALQVNESVVTMVRHTLQVQIAFAFVTGIFAVTSLMQ